MHGDLLDMSIFYHRDVDFISRKSGMSCQVMDIGRTQRDFPFCDAPSNVSGHNAAGARRSGSGRATRFALPATSSLSWMTIPPFSEKQLSGFNEAAQSLRLYRRAELHDPSSGDPLIEDLYVDPLPENGVLKKILAPNTTFLIGRKGTGKSTIFQRLQYELINTPTKTSAYVDIKTLFEQCQVDEGLLQRVSQLGVALPRPAIERLVLYRAFLKAVIGEIKSELLKRVNSSLLQRVRESITGSISELFEGLDALIEQADSDRFVSVLGIKLATTKESSSDSYSQTKARGIAGKLSDTPEISVEAKDSDTNSAREDNSEVYRDVLMRVFGITELITQLRALLGKIGVKHLYVLIDDFSELPRDAMQIVVDVLLAPLNNNSDELIKFKIAAYPGRVEYGDIDPTKVDEIYLDLYKLYGSSDVGAMERSATEFTKRLIETRLQFYCGEYPGIFFDKGAEDIWRTSFFASMANPRIVGHLLTYLYDTHVVYHETIGIRAINAAAQRYYEEKVEPFFARGKFVQTTFKERSSIFALKSLLEAVVRRAKELRTHRSAVMEKIPGRPPTSHFHVLLELEPWLSTLELNFFVTKYFEMSDRDGKKVVVFALNYGLCQKYTIAFGRPQGEREFRLYFVERIFDDSGMLRQFLREQQEIRCDKCGEEFPLDQLDALKLYGMRCPRCDGGICQVSARTPLTEEQKKTVDQALLLPKIDFEILQTLRTEHKQLRAGEIAGELDCSHQLIGRRNRQLVEKGLVDRSEIEPGRPLFSITDQAEEVYFGEDAKEPLDVPGD